VLKVAHHGSADAGLGALLDRSVPRAALIGVGENSYGHPTAETLETLAERGVCILRTDLDGDVWAEIGPGGVSIGAQSGGLSGRPACAPGG
jgi:competence protein ComEC